MTTLREAAQQALEALGQAHPKPYNEDIRAHVEAITALKAALEQLERATVKESLPVDCPACGGGGLIPDPTWDWVRCELCNPRSASAAIWNG